jgi:hypothetical protein
MERLHAPNEFFHVRGLRDLTAAAPAATPGPAAGAQSRARAEPDNSDGGGAVDGRPGRARCVNAAAPSADIRGAVLGADAPERVSEGGLATYAHGCRVLK